MNEFISLPRDIFAQAIRKLEAIATGRGTRENVNEVLSLLKNNYSSSSVNVSPSVRQSFSCMVDEVAEQIEADCYSGHGDSRDVMDICRIIAEMLIASPRLEDGTPRMVKINGAPTDIAIVQEIFRELKHGHIELVLENFKNTTAKIYNKRAYLQTALYNAVLEMDLHYTNQVKHDFGF